jgi:uncharacterized protein (DUF2344 family)
MTKLTEIDSWSVNKRDYNEKKMEKHSKTVKKICIQMRIKSMTLKISRHSFQVLTIQDCGKYVLRRITSELP